MLAFLSEAFGKFCNTLPRVIDNVWARTVDWDKEIKSQYHQEMAQDETCVRRRSYALNSERESRDRKARLLGSSMYLQ